jgi:hypothetical protein
VHIPFRSLPVLPCGSLIDCRDDDGYRRAGQPVLVQSRGGQPCSLVPICDANQFMSLRPIPVNPGGQRAGDRLDIRTGEGERPREP